MVQQVPTFYLKYSIISTYCLKIASAVSTATSTTADAAATEREEDDKQQANGETYSKANGVVHQLKMDKKCLHAFKSKWYLQN